MPVPSDVPDVDVEKLRSAYQLILKEELRYDLFETHLRSQRYELMKSKVQIELLAQGYNFTLEGTACPTQ